MVLSEIESPGGVWKAGTVKCACSVIITQLNHIIVGSSALSRSRSLSSLYSLEVRQAGRRVLQTNAAGGIKIHCNDNPLGRRVWTRRGRSLQLDNLLGRVDE